MNDIDKNVLALPRQLARNVGRMQELVETGVTLVCTRSTLVRTKSALEKTKSTLVRTKSAIVLSNSLLKNLTFDLKFWLTRCESRIVKGENLSFCTKFAEIAVKTVNNCKKFINSNPTRIDFLRPIVRLLEKNRFSEGIFVECYWQLCSCAQ